MRVLSAAQLVLTLASVLPRSAAFVPVRPALSHRLSVGVPPRTVRRSSDAPSSEPGELDDLIVSLSKESTDEIRRERLASLFATEMAKPNGAPAKFASAFDAALQRVGNAVQAAAREAAMERQAQNAGEFLERRAEEEEGGEEEEKEEEVASPPEGGKEEVNYMSEEKSAEERQLWALIDMMVQSKTIAKKASGSLGSEGTFG